MEAVGILNARFKKICKKIESGAIDINNIELELISENLCLASLPEPDLLIRTGGEKG